MHEGQGEAMPFKAPPAEKCEHSTLDSGARELGSKRSEAATPGLLAVINACGTAGFRWTTWALGITTKLNRRRDGHSPKVTRARVTTVMVVQTCGLLLPMLDCQCYTRATYI